MLKTIIIIINQNGNMKKMEGIKAAVKYDNSFQFPRQD